MSDDPFIDEELNHEGELFIYTVYILSNCDFLRYAYIHTM